MVPVQKIIQDFFCLSEEPSNLFSLITVSQNLAATGDQTSKQHVVWGSLALVWQAGLSARNREVKM